MRQQTRATYAPLAGLAVFLIGSELLSATFKAHGRPETASFVLLRSLGWLVWLGWWYEAETRRQVKARSFDIGFFLLFAWPFIVVHRLMASGRK